EIVATTPPISTLEVKATYSLGAIHVLPMRITGKTTSKKSYWKEVIEESRI
ncbi:4749_t:CDS:2, partial [Scutellospora calospora]